jgi:hypothetical protein
VTCLTVWVNSVLPEDKAISKASEVMSRHLVFTLLAERLSGQVIEGVTRAPKSGQEHETNLALTLAFLNSVGCNKCCSQYAVEYQTPSLGALTALCDVLWEMAEHFVMAPQFRALAVEADLQVCSSGGGGGGEIDSRGSISFEVCSRGMHIIVSCCFLYSLDSEAHLKFC